MEAKPDPKEERAKLKLYLRSAIEQRNILMEQVQSLTAELDARGARIEALEQTVAHFSAAQKPFDAQPEKHASIETAVPDCATADGFMLLKAENFELRGKLADFQRSRDVEFDKLTQSLRAEHELETIRKDSELAVLRQSARDLESQLSALKMETDIELNSTLRKQLESTALELSTLKETHASLETEFHDFRTKAGRLKKHLTTLRDENARVTDLEAENAIVKHELKEKTSLLWQIQEDSIGLEERISGSLAANSHLVEEVESLESELSQSKKAVLTLEQQLARERRDRSELMEGMRKQQYEMNELERSLAHVEAEFDSNRAELMELRRSAQVHQQELFGIARERNEVCQQLREVELERRQIVLQHSLVVAFEVREKEAEQEKPVEEPMVHAGYLRVLLMEFFKQNSKARTSLIPVMLRYLSCSGQEIELALQSWREADRKLKWF
jgi:myosin protein heavy chain